MEHKILWIGNDGLWVFDGRRWSKVAPSSAFKRLVIWGGYTMKTGDITVFFVSTILVILFIIPEEYGQQFK
jgi:hypothetical protein